MLRFPRLRLLLPLLLTFFVVMLLLRAGFYFYFLSGDDKSSALEMWQAFGMGARFDFRIALLMVLPIGVISLLPGVFGLRGVVGRALALLATTAFAGVMMFTYIVDFGHFAYLGVRLNASVLRFFEDGMDTFQMVWESYPVVWLVLLLIASCVLTWWFVARLIARYRRETTTFAWSRFALTVPLVLAVYFFGIVGKFNSVVPLRWSDAFFSDDPKVVALALNPAIFFTSTLKNESRPYDPALLAKTYPAVAAYLGVDHPDVKTFNFARHVAARPHTGRLPNIVFIHLESLGANRSGLFGNPLGATPNVDKAAKAGIFFPNFMVPASGTARTVFGLTTGIPDVTWGGSTATRNALISGQYTLVNAFKGYQKYYFLGGDAGWANVQGLLQHSIDDLHLYQEGDYDAPNVDVWGISDHSLFVAANKHLNSLPKDQPFVAFIQLAGNHRPFTIPKDEHTGFKLRDVSRDTLLKYGFLGLDQFNAIRLMDHNLGLYLYQMVPASHYANDTIFLMYGDHNDRSTEPSVLPGYSEPLGLNKHHVPFIIYAPGIIKQPQVREQVATLMDLMPTALGFTGLPYVNRTLGRDLMHWQGPGYALTFGGARSTDPSIGLLSSKDFLTMLYDGKNARFFHLDAPKTQVTDETETEAQRRNLLFGLYQTATYMLTHNPKHPK